MSSTSPSRKQQRRVQFASTAAASASTPDRSARNNNHHVSGGGTSPSPRGPTYLLDALLAERELSNSSTPQRNIARRSDGVGEDVVATSTPSTSPRQEEDHHQRHADGKDGVVADAALVLHPSPSSSSALANTLCTSSVLHAWSSAQRLANQSALAEAADERVAQLRSLTRKYEEVLQQNVAWRCSAEMFEAEVEQRRKQLTEVKHKHKEVVAELSSQVLHLEEEVGARRREEVRHREELRLISANTQEQLANLTRTSTTTAAAVHQRTMMLMEEQRERAKVVEDEHDHRANIAAACSTAFLRGWQQQHQIVLAREAQDVAKHVDVDMAERVLMLRTNIADLEARLGEESIRREAEEANATFLAQRVLELQQHVLQLQHSHMEHNEHHDDDDDPRRQKRGVGCGSSAQNTPTDGRRSASSALNDVDDVVPAKTVRFDMSNTNNNNNNTATSIHTEVAASSTMMEEEPPHAMAVDMREAELLELRIINAQLREALQQHDVRVAQQQRVAEERTRQRTAEKDATWMEVRALLRKHCSIMDGALREHAAAPLPSWESLSAKKKKTVSSMHNTSITSSPSQQQQQQQQAQDDVDGDDGDPDDVADDHLQFLLHSQGELLHGMLRLLASLRSARHHQHTNVEQHKKMAAKAASTAEDQRRGLQHAEARLLDQQRHARVAETKMKLRMTHMMEEHGEALRSATTRAEVAERQLRVLEEEHKLCGKRLREAATRARQHEEEDVVRVARIATLEAEMMRISAEAVGMDDENNMLLQQQSGMSREMAELRRCAAELDDGATLLHAFLDHVCRAMVHVLQRQEMMRVCVQHHQHVARLAQREGRRVREIVRKLRHHALFSKEEETEMARLLRMTRVDASSQHNNNDDDDDGDGDGDGDDGVERPRRPPRDTSSSSSSLLRWCAPIGSPPVAMMASQARRRRWRGVMWCVRAALRLRCLLVVVNDDLMEKKSTSSATTPGRSLLSLFSRPTLADLVHDDDDDDDDDERVPKRCRSISSVLVGMPSRDDLMAMLRQQRRPRTNDVTITNNNNNTSIHLGAVMRHVLRSLRVPTASTDQRRHNTTQRAWRWWWSADARLVPQPATTSSSSSLSWSDCPLAMDLLCHLSSLQQQHQHWCEEVEMDAQHTMELLRQNEELSAALREREAWQRNIDVSLASLEHELTAQPTSSPDELLELRRKLAAMDDARHNERRRRVEAEDVMAQQQQQMMGLLTERGEMQNDVRALRVELSRHVAEIQHLKRQPRHAAATLPQRSILEDNDYTPHISNNNNNATPPASISHIKAAARRHLQQQQQHVGAVATPIRPTLLSSPLPTTTTTSSPSPHVLMAPHNNSTPITDVSRGGC